MVMLTRKQLPVVLKLDSSSFFGGAVRDQSKVIKSTLRALFVVDVDLILKTNTPLQSPYHSLNEDCLLARIQRELTP